VFNAFDFDGLDSFGVVNAFKFSDENISHSFYFHVEYDVFKPRNLLLALDGTVAETGLNQLGAVSDGKFFGFINTSE
jgi:hypothetical protein